MDRTNHHRGHISILSTKRRADLQTELKAYFEGIFYFSRAPDLLPMIVTYHTSNLLLILPAIATLFYFLPSLVFSLGIQAAETKSTAMNPASALQVSISQIHDDEASQNPETSCQLKATVHNTADHVVTLLNWGTPLDPRANILGVFEVRDTTTDTPVEMVEVMFSRKLPPSSDELVEIAGHDSVTANVILDRAKPPAGKKYSIRAKGWLQTVWDMPKEDAISNHIKELSGGSSGEFVSNTIEVE